MRSKYREFLKKCCAISKNEKNGYGLSMAIFAFIAIDNFVQMMYHCISEVIQIKGGINVSSF